MASASRTCLSIVLAAGKGTRMRSALPKVLHPVAHLPMLQHVMNAARDAGSDRIAVVVGHEAERVRGTLDASPATFEQTEQLGTAHAVLTAREAIERGASDVLVLFGDTPLLLPETLRRARNALVGGASIAVVGFEAEDPTGYGRLLVRDEELIAIREERDATDEERRVTLCNGGIMAFDGARMLDILDRIGTSPSGEFYLTDAIEIARGLGLRSLVVRVDIDEVRGVNDRAQLAEVEAIWQKRRRLELMVSGVAMPAPDTVHLAHDTMIEPDATVAPFVVFGPGARVSGGATVLSHSHIDGATIAPRATVGPFARLRPGTEVGEGAKVGNFCEVKNATLDAGAKVNHLSYIGDATVGARANIGAGTITCNYDGANKHRTDIGANAFVGSNSALVAPVSVGDGSYVASGSVITKDVPNDALAFGRARQANRDGGGAALRERVEREKARRKLAAE